MITWKGLHLFIDLCLILLLKKREFMQEQSPVLFLMAIPAETLMG